MEGGQPINNILVFGNVAGPGGYMYVLKQIDGYRQKDSQTEDRKMDRRNKSLIEELRS